jgi:hypothetical protein
MASNRRWRGPFRYRGSRHESAVAQLSTLGSTAHERFYTVSFDASFRGLPFGCSAFRRPSRRCTVFDKGFRADAQASSDSHSLGMFGLRWCSCLLGRFKPNLVAAAFG